MGSTIIRYEKIRIICLFLLGVLSYSAKSDELKKYFSKEIELPVYDYLSLSKDYSFDNDVVVNELVKIDPVNYGISETPEFLARYRITDMEWSPGGPEETTTFWSSVHTLGWISFTPKYKGYLISNNSFEGYKVDLWIFDGKTPLNHICLFFALKEEGPENLNDMTIEVESKILKDKTIEWHWNNYGLHRYSIFKLNQYGQFEVIESRTEGKYNGPYSEEDDDSDEYHAEDTKLVRKTIDDVDGYVNVRSKPNANSEILYTIPTKTKVLCHEIKDSNWVEIVEVENSERIGGYVHKSRLK
ncbi:MAG: SH3 domain-containing protein [Paludibacteraceae bacterium]|nr:SH3 domain-containing protein [Paludibacteraceae bacterium]